jgi:ribosomal-protein-alanine N-acetyltransferase
MLEFSVRAAEAEDVLDVLALERATAEAPHWGKAAYAAMVGGETGYVRRSLFVAEAAGRLVGFAVGKVVADVGELESVAVDSLARRGGVGRALCGAVIAWCREQGAAWVELEVRAMSEGAIGLYRGLGFFAVGRRPRYYAEPVDDAVLMRLDLFSGGPGVLPARERL